MTKTRRRFTDAFERAAVALLESGGRPPMQLAAELGLPPLRPRSWRAAVPGARTGAATFASATPRVPSPAEPAAERARLRRELDRTRQDRDVLKAIAIFSKAPR
jgi:transposase